jgi:hypothetical protein
MSAPILPVFIGKSPYLAERVSSLNPSSGSNSLPLRFPGQGRRSCAASGARDPRRFELRRNFQNVMAVSEKIEGCD